MKINHIIFGVIDLEESLKFYETILDYKLRKNFVDTGTGQSGAVVSKKNSTDILLVPFKNERLPSPQHVAFEVTDKEFNLIYKNVTDFGLNIRSLPPLNSTELGIGETIDNGIKYKRFFFVDPNNINLEIMKIVKD